MRPGAKRQAAGAMASSRGRRHLLPACLAGKKQLAGTGQHNAGPPGGLGGGLRLGKSFPFIFSFVLFLFSISIIM